MALFTFNPSKPLDPNFKATRIKGSSRGLRGVNGKNYILVWHNVYYPLEQIAIDYHGNANLWKTFLVNDTLKPVDNNYKDNLSIQFVFTLVPQKIQIVKTPPKPSTPTNNNPPALPPIPKQEEKKETGLIDEKTKKIYIYIGGVAVGLLVLSAIFSSSSKSKKRKR